MTKDNIIGIGQSFFNINFTLKPKNKEWFHERFDDVRGTEVEEISITGSFVDMV